MKRIAIIAFALLLIPAVGWGFWQMVGGVADFCSSQTWATYTTFKLDFDNPTDTKTACLSTGTEVGTLNNAATIVNEATPRPGSGGNALLINANTRNISFDNGLPYFQSLYGSLRLKVMVSEATTGTDYIFFAGDINDPNKNRFIIYVDGISHKLVVLWEDNDNGAKLITTNLDFDSYYGDWAEIEVKWNPNTGANELGVRYIVDDDRSGAYDGAEAWSAWAYQTDINTFAGGTEPGADEIRIGLYAATYSKNIYLDDIQLSTAQPTW